MFRDGHVVSLGSLVGRGRNCRRPDSERARALWFLPRGRRPVAALAARHDRDRRRAEVSGADPGTLRRDHHRSAAPGGGSRFQPALFGRVLPGCRTAPPAGRHVAAVDSGSGVPGDLRGGASPGPYVRGGAGVSFRGGMGRALTDKQRSHELVHRGGVGGSRATRRRARHAGMGTCRDRGIAVSADARRRNAAQQAHRCRSQRPRSHGRPSG